MTDDLGSRLPADAELAEQLRVGDPRALTALFEAYFDALVRFAYGFVGSRDTAKDVVQEVFVHLWEAPEVLRAVRSLRQYLYAAVRNRALNERKREGVRARYQAAAMAAERLVYRALGELRKILQVSAKRGG